MKIKNVLVLSSFLLFSAQALLHSATYKIDPVHSVICFKIDHLMISKTWGRFNSFSGEIVYGKDVKQENWKCSAVIDVKSIDTGNSMRDEHLRGKDVFNTEKFPEIKFKAVKLGELKEKNNLHYGKLIGELTMMGVTKPVVLTGKVTGTVKNVKGMPGANIIGFEASTTINRNEFGMAESEKLENGSLMIGNQVDIFLQIEAVQKQ